MTDQLQVPVVAPPLPLILADSAFLSTLANVEQQVATLKIVDAQSSQQAADLLTRLTAAGKKLDATRAELKRPFREIAEKIDAAAREPAARIEQAKTTLKTASTAFELEQQRIASEAEKKRQAELARLEKIRLAEEAEAKRKADEIARQLAEANAKQNAPVMEIQFDDVPEEPAPKTETEKAIEAVKFAPAPVAAKPTGVRYKVTLKAVVEDVNKLPDCFVTKIANLRGIQSTFCAGWKEGQPLPVLAGVRFEIERTTESTGRAVF